MDRPDICPEEAGLTAGAGVGVWDRVGRTELSQGVWQGATVTGSDRWGSSHHFRDLRTYGRLQSFREDLEQGYELGAW